MRALAVAGAGIGGLTAAMALARAGATVDVYESAPVLAEAGAGLQLAPNATRALKTLGLFETVDAVSVRPDGARIRRGSDGAEITRFPYGAQAEQRYGAPFLVLHRADLQGVLLDAVAGMPTVALHTGLRIESFSSRDDGLDLRLVDTDGRERSARAEGLVGADGLRSRVRTLLHPDEKAQGLRVDKIAWRALVPAEYAPPMARLPSSNLWLGPDLHLVHYPVRGGRLINVVAIAAGRVPADDLSADLWATTGAPETIRNLFRPWCRESRALIEAAESWRIWPLFDRRPLSFWSKDRVTVLGDAAHPMLPFLAQGASQAIEDAAALGDAVAQHGDAAAAFRAYEATRISRANRVQRDSHRQATIYHLQGLPALARDLAMRTLGPGRLMARYDYIYRS